MGKEIMKITIDIPEKEFGIEISDKFQDFFSRLKAEIKARLISGTDLVCGAYELETIDMFLKAFNDCTPLPKVHGRLIILSEDRLKENQINLDWSCQKWISEVGLSNATVRIIKVDTESEDINNLCNQCSNERCIFQSGIVRSHCDFYKAESEGKK